MSSTSDTIRIAHTARCKLHMAANHPDRNFRLILGHALTLDKLLLRVAEIESDGSESDEEGIANEEPSGPHSQQRRVSFSASSRQRAAAAAAATGNDPAKRQRSPPPNTFDHDDDAVGDDDEDIVDEDDDDEGGNGLSLQRFPSAAAQPPRMVPDEGDDDDDDDAEPISPPDYSPSEEEIKRITEGAANPGLTSKYHNVVRCPCSKQHADAPKVSNMWELPGPPGAGGKRRALVQVEA